VKQRIAVIGAGVIGSAVFARLSETGHDVTLYDKGAPGSGSSAVSFAWINSNNKTPEPYFELNRAALLEHTRRQHSGSRAFHQTGYYELATEQEHIERLQNKVQRLADWGYDVEVLPPEAAQLALPELASSTVQGFNAFFPQEGYCNIPAFIAECLDAGRKNGGRFILSEVLNVETTPSGVTVHERNGPSKSFDRAVIAVGRWTQKLTQGCGINIPMHDDHTPGSPNLGFLALTVPTAVSLRSVVTTSDLGFRPEGHGRLMLQSLPLDAQAGPNRQYPPRGTITKEFERRLSSTFNTGFPISVDRIKVGYRPLTKDGFTTAGFADSNESLYVIATHSAITLAPLLAQFAAAEISGNVVQTLAPFRPSRFRAAPTIPPHPITAARTPGDQ
jgi:glycine/D-amino acid oxidase-like deaminating enzyme